MGLSTPALALHIPGYAGPQPKRSVPPPSLPIAGLSFPIRSIPCLVPDFWFYTTLLNNPSSLCRSPSATLLSSTSSSNQLFPCAVRFYSVIVAPGLIRLVDSRGKHNPPPVTHPALYHQYLCLRLPFYVWHNPTSSSKKTRPRGLSRLQSEISVITGSLVEPVLCWVRLELGEREKNNNHTATAPVAL